MATTNTEVLERLLIEVVGDDSTLKQFLDAAVKGAKKAAQEMRDALAIDFGRVTQGAKATAEAVDEIGSNVTEVRKIFDQFVTQGVAEFDKVRAAGERTEAQFEEYRQTILQTIESQRPMAQAVGVTSEAMDALAKHVREATYEQSENVKEAARAKQEQEELAATIKRLSNEVRGSRNDWAGKRTDDAEFKKSTTELRAELDQLIGTLEKGSDAYRKVSQEIAYAQRGLDSANKEASRGGLAWTTQIALTNQFGDALRGMGPAGAAAAGGLGIMSGAVKAMRTPITAATLDVNALTAASARMAAVVVPLGVALAALTAGGLLFKLSKDAAAWAGELDNASVRLNTTTEGLQELRHAAKVTGVSTNALEGSLQSLARRAAAAAQGAGPAAKAYKQLGIDVLDANGLLKSSDELLGEIADGFARLKDPARASALAFDLMNRTGTELLPMLVKGREGLEALRREARELGLVVSGESVMSLAEFDSKLKVLQSQFETVRIEVTAAFLPVMQSLMDFVQTTLVPWIQNAADEVVMFANTLFDSSEQGDQLRDRLTELMVPMARLAMGAIAFGRAVFLGMQTIVGGIRLLVLNTKIFWEEFNNLKLPTTWQEFIGIPELIPEKPRDSGGRGTYLDELRKERDEFADGFLDLIETASDPLLDAIKKVFNDDIPTFVRSSLQALVRPGGSVSRQARSAGEALGLEFGDGTREALVGSLKYAQEQLQKAQEELAYAPGPEARAEQLAVVRLWEEAVSLIQAELERFDPSKAAKLWVARLGAELKLGLKSAADVYGILQPRLEELRAEAASALVEFGIDSTQYQDVVAKLDVVEGLVSQIKAEATQLDLSGLIRSVGGGLAVPDSGADPTKGLLDGLQLIMRIEEQEAKLEGRALNVGEAFAWMLPILEEQLDLAERGTEAWFATSELIARIRGDLNAIDTTDLLRSVGGGLSIPDGSKSVTRALVEGFEIIIRTEEALAGMRGEAAQLSDEYEWMVELLDEHAATLTQGSEEWLQTVEAANRYRALISNLPGFTGIGGFATPEQTKTATDGLIEGHAWLLKVAEAEDVLAGKNRDLAGTYSGMIDEMLLHINTLEHGSDAWLQAVGALEAYYEALEHVMSGEEVAASGFEAWAEGVARIGVTIDPISAAFADLGTLMASGKITTEEYALGIDTVFAAMDRLNQLEFDAGLGSWTDAVQRLGVASDPIRDAREQLEKLFAGKEDAEGYAAALELLAAAEERLAGIEADAAAKKAAEGWRTAGQQISAFLRVNQVDLSDLRDAAEDAFKAGVIGADELAVALKRIDVMEVVGDLRLLGSELGGAQGIIPNLLADLGQAWAQLAAGNTTDAIATAFNAVTAAVKNLGAAFEDAEHQGEAMLDLVIGGAAAIATALGGPAMGQAVAAIGNFIKSVLGDLSNGLAAIEKQIKQTATSSQYLGEGLIRGIAEGATREVSRGGLLGLLGFTKQELDDDAFRAGVSIAEGLAQGMVNTLRSGDFEEAWQAFIDDVIINGVIEAFIATALVQDAIQEAMELIMGGDAAGGAAALDRLKNDFYQVWQTIQSITSTPLPDPSDLERSVLFSLPDATVSVLAAPQWALELGAAATRMSEAGTAMLSAAEAMRDTFDDGIHVSFEPAPRGIDAARSL